MLRMSQIALFRVGGPYGWLRLKMWVSVEDLSGESPYTLSHTTFSYLKYYISLNSWWSLLNLEVYTLPYVILMSDI